MLRSKALEITVESCITSPLSGDQGSNLAQLLGTFLPRTDNHALAGSVAQLGQLLGEDAQAFDTTGAAQRAVRSVVAALKVAKGDEAAAARPASLPDRLATIEREAGKQRGFLASVEKLAAAGGGAAAAADPTKPRAAQQSSGISK